MNTPTASLTLDKRQRAMLKEMGVRVWSPLAVPVSASPTVPTARAPAVATESIAVPAIKTRAMADIDVEKALDATPSPPAAADEAQPGNRWQFNAAHALFADAPSHPGPRWLVLAEAPSSLFDVDSTPADPLQGDAGQLLGNMLRAARLAHPGRAVLVLMSRATPAGSETAASTTGSPDLMPQLAALVATHQPDLVLVMGRLAAQALLGTTEPLGKLRGRVHHLQGVPTVVTYDAQPLLRTPADKAKAWDDLCLGIATAAATQTPGVDGKVPGG